MVSTAKTNAVPRGHKPRIRVSGPRISATTARTAIALEYGTPFAPSEAAKDQKFMSL
jgi:hypothetical protein